MRFKSLAYLLALLVMWGWVDDLCVALTTPDVSDDSCTSDNDQYLSTPSFAALSKDAQKHPSRDRLASSARRSALMSAGRFASPLVLHFLHAQILPIASTDPVYALMSLQR